MTSDGPWWRIGPEGTPQGPYTADEIRSMLKRGRLRCSDPVWSPAGGEWKSLDRTQVLDGDKATRAPILALTVAAVAYAAVVGWMMFEAHKPFDPVNPPSLWILRMFWIGPALMLAASTFVLVRLGQRSAARIRRRPWLAKTLRAASMLCGGGGGVLVIGSLAGVTTQPQQFIETARESYSVDVIPETNRIVVSGTIGYGFARTMQEALDKVADPVRIEIMSPGGLANEALEAARAIEAHPGATVVAGWICNSGCIVVLMGGTHRLAEKGGFLGFHARDDVAAQSERFVVLGLDLKMALADIPTDDYLIGRGVPADIVAETNRRGTNDIYNVPTETLLERGVLTGLVDHPSESEDDVSTER